MALRNPNDLSAYYLWSGFVSFKICAPYFTTGDVNLDDEIDVADINILINIILGNDDAGKYQGRADVTGDGVIDVSDINSVLNIIMTK